MTRSVGPGWWVTANSTRATATLRTSVCTPRTARAVEARSPHVTTINVTATTTACEIHLRAHPSDSHRVSKTPFSCYHTWTQIIYWKKTQHVLSIFKYLSSVSAFSANNVGKKFWFKVSGDENRIAIKVGTTKQGFYQTLHRVTIGLGTKAHILPYRTKSIILWPYLGIVSVFKNVNWVSTWHNTCIYILFDLILKINCRPSLPLLDTKIVSHIDYFITLLIYII